MARNAWRSIGSTGKGKWLMRRADDIEAMIEECKDETTIMTLREAVTALRLAAGRLFDGAA